MSQGFIKMLEECFEQIIGYVSHYINMSLVHGGSEGCEVLNSILATETRCFDWIFSPSLLILLVVFYQNGALFRMFIHNFGPWFYMRTVYCHILITIYECSL
jgi:hypothetical protein